MEPHDSLIPKHQKKTVLLASFVAVVILLGLLASYLKTNSLPISDTNHNTSNSCHLSYEQLLKVNEFDFSACTNTYLRGGDYEALEESLATHLILVFDASGSMAGDIEGKTKLDIAKEATKSFLADSKIDTNLEVGIIVYGHQGDNTEKNKSLSCEGVETIYPLSKIKTEEAINRMDSFQATGWTPIEKSLLLAEKMLSERPAKENVILLVSDGEETCGGDPIARVKVLKNSPVPIQTSVIGFAVAGQDEAQLRSIAEAGAGEYYSVATAKQLKEAFTKYRSTIAEADYKIGRIIEEVHDTGTIFHNYVQCLAALKREEAAMLLDINANNLLGTKCIDYGNQTYRERYLTIEKHLNEIFAADKQSFEATRSR